MDGGRTRVKYWLAVAAFVGFLAHAPGVAFAQSPAATPEIPRTLPEAYVVMPFENSSGVVALDAMRAGFAATLAEKLESHPGLRSVHGELIIPDGAPPAIMDAAAVVAASQKSGARYVWTGSFHRPNWKLELTVKLWSVDKGVATLVGSRTAVATFEECFRLIDEAALELLAKAGRPAPAATADRIKRAPTKDYYAFVLYSRGLVAMHGLGGAVNMPLAEKNLSRATFIDPKFAEAHRLLAVVHQRKGELSKMSGQLTYALDLRPDYYAPLALLVKNAWDRKDRDETRVLAERALALRPWDLEVRYMLADTLWEQGDNDRAHKELKRLTSFRPDHIAARRILVLVHASQGNVKELAVELEAIVRMDPSDDTAKLDLGAAYSASGRDDDAIKIYESILARHPSHLQALKFLGDLHQARGDLATAMQYYERALAANRDDPRPYFLLGAVYMTAGKDAEALKIYLAAQKFPRYLGETYANIGAIYYKQGNNEQALWYLSNAVKKRPTSARSHYNYGLALSKNRQRDKALEELTAASELDPTDADFRYAAGVVLLRLGRLEEAEKKFEDAVKIAPRHASARHNLQLIDELRRRAREGEISIE
jgi:tetratricopeptide (TPR) repeat protein